MSVLPDSLANRDTTVPGAIKAGATNLTLGSGILAFLAVIGTAIQPVFETVFPKGASSGIRAAVLVAVIRSGRLHWPHRGRLIWPHFASVVVGVDVD